MTTAFFESPIDETFTDIQLIREPRPDPLAVISDLAEHLDVGQQIDGIRRSTDQNNDVMVDQFDLRRVSDKLLTFVAEVGFVEDTSGFIHQREGIKPFTRRGNSPRRTSLILSSGEPIWAETIGFWDPNYMVGQSNRYDVRYVRRSYPPETPLDEPTVTSLDIIAGNILEGAIQMRRRDSTTSASFDGTDYRALKGYEAELARQK